MYVARSLLLVNFNPVILLNTIQFVQAHLNQFQTAACRVRSLVSACVIAVVTKSDTDFFVCLFVLICFVVFFLFVCFRGSLIHIRISSSNIAQSIPPTTDHTTCATGQALCVLCGPLFQYSLYLHPSTHLLKGKI